MMQELYSALTYDNYIFIYTFLGRPQATCTSQTIVLDESVPSGIDLYCNAHGNPPPNIQWYRANVDDAASDGKLL